MKDKRNLFQRMTEEMDLPGEGVFALPLIEIAGDNRVLIENHLGVWEYSQERIGINMKYGAAIICGCGLELSRMTREQLVISGRIDGIMLQRRESR